MKHIQVI